MLLEAIRFEPFPDTVQALRELRAAGLRLVAASNWDVSLHEQLERTGLRPLLDGAVSSAEAGAAKPDPAILVRALAIAGAEPAHAWHVGDDVEADVGGAMEAGLAGILVRTGKFREDLVSESGIQPTATVDSIADVPGLIGSS